MVNYESDRRLLKELVLPATVLELGFQVEISPFVNSVLRIAHVVQNGHDSGLGQLFFDELADNGVVEVVNRGPCNALIYIFFLKNIMLCSHCTAAYYYKPTPP